MLGNVVGTKHPVLYLNVPMDVLKQIAADEISRGSPVWFGSDVGKHFIRKYSQLGPELEDFEGYYGTDRNLTKSQRLQFGQSLMTHAMLLTGVHVPGSGTRKVTTGPGKEKEEPGNKISVPATIDAKDITRWRIQNSWGTRLGNDGYLTASDSWMDEYTYQIVVDRARLPQKAKVALETDPVVLPPWDPMGALAVGFDTDEARPAGAGPSEDQRQ